MSLLHQTAGTTSRVRWRRTFAAFAAALVVTLVAVAPASPAHAGAFTAHVIRGKGVSFVNVRQATTTSSAVLRTIPSGAAVGLNCFLNGQTVTGPYGKSSIWYSIDGGGYVTDAYLETGSNSAVTAGCGNSGTGFALPFPAGSQYKVTTSPGTSSHADKYNRNAVDFANGKAGGAVVASAGGTVYAEGWKGAGGIVVLIDHGNNRCSQYAHLSSSVIDKGNNVTRGQKIGTVGGSGNGKMNAYGPHLHWNMVKCSDSTSLETISTAERGTSYPAGTWVTSQNR
jgi:hypothetical protein